MVVLVVVVVEVKLDLRRSKREELRKKSYCSFAGIQATKNFAAGYSRGS